MKKLSIFLGLSAIFTLSLAWNTVKSEYDLQINTGNNEVVLSSGDNKITLDDAEKALANSGDLNTLLNWTWDTAWTGSTNDSWDAILTWSQANTWDTVWTGDNIWTWSQTNSWTNVNSWSTNTWDRIFWDNVNAELLTGDEFAKAQYWMYMNWLTKFDKFDDYRPYDSLTREESAKMIGQLYSVLWFPEEDKWFNCNFVDTNLFNPTLAEHIYNVCKRWIFKWNSNTQQYMPRDPLTKGQLLAVLMRILEWKTSNESANPRWIEYYVKAFAIWMTNEKILTKFDQPVSRWEAALLIFRFKNMVIDEDQYKILLASLNNLAWDTDNYTRQIEELKAQWEATQKTESSSQTDNSNPDSNSIPTTWDISNTWSSVSLDIIAGNQTLTDSPEFIEAINWMYDNWMTSFNTTESFMPYQTITRGQVAKMIDKFAIATNLTEIRNSWSCQFSDVDTNSEYKEHITRVCQYGVMAWSKDKFFPDQIVTKAEFVSMLIRLFDWKSLDENTNPRRVPYYKRAIEIWLISAQDTVTFSANIARYEVAVFLYRLKVRLTMYNNLNSSQISDEVIKTLPETTSTGDDWKTSSKIFVNVLALNNSAFTDGYVEILWNRYRIKKSSVDSYNVWVNSFVRYWTLYNIESWDYEWSLSFILTNWTLTEWAIRIKNSGYYLSKDINTTTYYNLTQH